MDILNSIILGITQGITEFLPISSSGHLIIVREILGDQVSYGLAFDAVLQLATTLAVLVYFWRDITKYIGSFFKIMFNQPLEDSQRVLVFALIWGTIPAVVLGLFLENIMETAFRNPLLVSLTLIIGAGVMFFAEKNAAQSESITQKKGLKIGFYQALALIPGMSRSGMTISGGLRAGLNREEATRFSFLLAFPILLGSGLKKLLDLFTSGIIDSVGSGLLLGSLVSFIVGLCAIHFLVKYLKTHSMNIFVIYRVILALGIAVFYLI